MSEPVRVTDSDIPYLEVSRRELERGRPHHRAMFLWHCYTKFRDTLVLTLPWRADNLVMLRRSDFDTLLKAKQIVEMQHTDGHD